MRTAFPFAFSVLLGLTSAQAQQTARPLQVLVLGDKTGATLRLPILPQGLPRTGYVVKRTGPGGTQALTVRPINKLEATSKFGVAPRDYEIVIGALETLSDGKITQEQRGFLLLNLLRTVTQPKLARAVGLLFDDVGLAAGNYTYSVSADQQSLGSVTVQVGKVAPLPAPTGLKAAAGLRQVNLSWLRGDDSVVAYQVQRASGVQALADLTADPQLINRGETPSLTDSRLDPRLTYRYRVTALDVFGRESEPSASVTLEARLTVPLTAPLITSVQNTQNQVKLGWEAPSDAGVKQITVLRGDHPGKLTVLARLGGSERSYTDTSAPPASPRYYALKVSDGSRESAASPERVGRAYNLTPPSAPQALSAVDSEQAITLSWKPGAEPDLDGYNVYRAELGPDNRAPLTLLNGAPIKAATFKDSVPQGVQSRFQYSVRAINTSGVEGPPSATVQAELLDKTAPDSPLLLRAQANDDGGPPRIALIFTLPPTADLKAYEVYRAAQNEAAPQLVATLPPSSLGYLDSQVKSGLPYSYAVVALDTHGNASRASNVLAAQPPAARLSAPSDLKAAINGQQVTLSWTDSPAALAYYVFRIQAGRRLQVAGPLLQARYQEAASKGARYSVQAVNEAGTLGPMSAEVEAR